MVAIFLLVAFAAPWMTKLEPLHFHGPSLAPPSHDHMLGTNSLGQDVFTKLLYGTRTSLLVSLMVAGISTSLSLLLGLWAGYKEKADRIINGVANVILAVPNLLFALMVFSFTRGSLWMIILILSFLSWAGYMRIIRSQVLTLREREFVKVARIYQAKPAYILWRHILPHLFPIIRAKFLITAQNAVATEAGLSFLGLGDPEAISWGMMLHDAFRLSTTFLTDAWQWLIIPPTLMLVLLTVSLSLIADAEMEDNKQKSIKRKINLLQKPEKKQIETIPVNFDNSEAVLTVDKLSIVYGETPIISNVSFSIARGEICLLIGESGVGKTSIARAVMGILEHGSLSGDIYFQQKHVLKMTDKQRNQLKWVDISMIFQDARQALNPLLTIGEQISEVLKVHSGYSFEHSREETYRLLREVDLDIEVAQRYPHEISGGMCNRAVIAMALANKPRLLIADEPTSSLDPLLRKQILLLLKKKVVEQKLSLLFITHDIGIVAEMADQVVVLKDGRMVENRNVYDWFDRPQTEYSKNLLSLIGES